VELADTSSWSNRQRDESAAADFRERLLDGEIATCDQVKAELLWSARNADDFADIVTELRALTSLPITEDVWTRAFEVMHEFARQGPLHHRRVKFADLLIAATAESAGVGVCHYDGDFDKIAAITGQPVRPIAPMGSLH
jgi:hypothetical protein